MSELYARTVSELSEELRTGRVSSVELTRLFLERAERSQGVHSAFSTTGAERALEAARAADARLQGGPAGPLTGIPLAHKDIFCTRREKTSCGSRMLAALISPYDATVVERLREAG